MSGSLVGSQNSAHTTTRLPRSQPLGKPAVLHATTTFLTSNIYTGALNTHRCRSRQIFGGAKDFFSNFPKLARKKLQRKWRRQYF